MASLEELCAKVRNTKGMTHLTRLELLRDYLKYVQPDTFTSQLAAIKDADLLLALQEAGVRKQLQPAFNERLKELVG